MKGILSYQETLSSYCAYSPGEIHFSELNQVEKDSKIEKAISGDAHLIWNRLVLPMENLLKICPYCKSNTCLLYTSPSPRDKRQSRMPSSA